MYTQKLEIATIGSNTWTDITNLLSPKGLEWSRININTSKSTTMDGVDHLARIRQKYQVKATFRELTDTQEQTLLAALAPEKIKVRTYSPVTGSQVVLEVRVSDINIGFFAQTSSAAYWKGFSVTFAED